MLPPSRAPTGTACSTNPVFSSEPPEDPGGQLPDAERIRFAEIYAEMRSPLLRQVRRVLPPHDAEEVVHDTFLQLWQHPQRFDPSRGSLRTYLHMVARSKAVDLLRARGAGQRRDAVWDRTNHDDQTTFDIDGQREEVRDALAALPAKQCVPIVVAFFTAATYAEVATRLGVPEGTLKFRIRSGLAQLRTTLSAGPEIDVEVDEA